MAEHLAIAKLLSLGKEPLLPVINRGYDIAVGSNGHIYKLEVKMTGVFKGGQYEFTFRVRNRKHAPYTKDENDFFLFYVAPDDNWYIIPSSEVVGHSRFRIRPKGQYKKYLNAWELIP